MSDILRRAFDRAVLAAERRAWTPGRLGMTNADGTVTISVPDRPNWVYVALGPDGSQGVTVARNDAGVPLRVYLPVKMQREESGVMAIQGVYNAGGLADVGATDTPIVTEYGVPPHPHTHGELAGLTDDDHTQYPLLAGRSGGQTIYGGTASGDDLTLESTSHATKGAVDIQPNGGATTVGGTLGVSGNATFSDRVGIGTAAPKSTIGVVQKASSTIPALGAASAHGVQLSNVGDAYGLSGGILGNGNAWFQVQRVDGNGTAYHLLLQPTAGNVGIGTTSPASKLDVNGDIGTAWTNVTFEENWETYERWPQYKRFGDLVLLRGSAQGIYPNTPIFTLPSGFRPPNDVYFYNSINGHRGEIAVYATGVVYGDGSLLSFEGIVFSTA